MIQEKLKSAFGIAADVVPNGRMEDFARLASQTSMQERESLYAATRHNYSGEGDIWDIGCAAGGSSFCLASGLQDRACLKGNPRVKCFDLFGGYSGKAFSGRFPAHMSDLDIFRLQTHPVRSFVKAEKMNLATSFGGYSIGRRVEIAHIDAAKTLELWRSIFERLAAAVIPGKTIWIYQDFERARLPWQVYSLHELLRCGEIIGGANFGSVYFRFNSEIPSAARDKIAKDKFAMDERVKNIKAIFAKIRSDFTEFFSSDSIRVDDIENTMLAYCYYWDGQKERARSIIKDTSEVFLASPAHKIYADEILGAK
jgi:hypothetical protein